MASFRQLQVLMILVFKSRGMGEDVSDSRATITAPTVHPRQVQEGTPTNLIGWSSSGAVWLPQGCQQGSTITLSSSFGACAPATATSFGIATACSDGSVLLLSTTSYSCGINVCYTISLFNNLDDTNHNDFFACGTARREISVYKTTPTTSITRTTTSLSSTSRSSISSTALTSDTIDTTDTTNAIVRTSSATTSPSPFFPLENSNAASSPPSKDWIAGAVLGPLAALLIIAGLAFWIGRRSRSPPPASASHASSAVAPMPNQGQVMSGYPGVATAVEAPSYVYGVPLPQQQQQQQPLPPELHGQGGHSTDWRGRGELAG